MPIDYARYGPEWPAISRRIRDRHLHAAHARTTRMAKRGQLPLPLVEVTP
jgi:hypothetical protein